MCGSDFCRCGLALLTSPLFRVDRVAAHKLLRRHHHAAELVVGQVLSPDKPCDLPNRLELVRWRIGQLRNMNSRRWIGKLLGVVIRLNRVHLSWMCWSRDSSYLHFLSTSFSISSVHFFFHCSGSISLVPFLLLVHFHFSSHAPPISFWWRFPSTHVRRPAVGGSTSTITYTNIMPADEIVH